MHARNVFFWSLKSGSDQPLDHRIGMRTEGKAEPDNDAVFEGMQDVKVHNASSQQLSVFLTLLTLKAMEVEKISLLTGQVLKKFSVSE